MEHKLYEKIQTQIGIDKDHLVPIKDVVKNGMTLREFIEINPRRDTDFRFSNYFRIPICEIENFLDSTVQSESSLPNVVVVNVDSLDFQVVKLQFTKDVTKHKVEFNSEIKHVFKINERYFIFNEDYYELFPKQNFNGKHILHQDTIDIFVSTKNIGYNIPKEIQTMLPIVDLKYKEDEIKCGYQRDLIRLNKTIFDLLHKDNYDNFYKTIRLKDIVDSQEIECEPGHGCSEYSDDDWGYVSLNCKRYY